MKKNRIKAMSDQEKSSAVDLVAATLSPCCNNGLSENSVCLSPDSCVDESKHCVLASVANDTDSNYSSGESFSEFLAPASCNDACSCDNCSSQATPLDPSLKGTDVGDSSCLADDPETEHAHEGSSSKVVSLCSHDLADIPKSLLEVAEEVEELDFAYNSLTALPESFIQRLLNVSVLSVSGNEISELPSCISCLQQLCDLNISDNKLSAFPSSLVSLSKLRVLNFAGNCITILPAEFGRLTALETVFGYENKLTKLPDTFGLLHRLSILELGDNMINCLPRNFGFLRSLKTLNLSANRLEVLPDSLSNLEAVEFMDLSGNMIDKLPVRFRSCTCLRRLFVEKNRLKTLPDWFENMPALEALGLKDNHLVECALPERLGNVSKRLRILELAGNYITKLPDSLGKLTMLERIHIGSVIDEIERKNFQNGNWIWKLPQNFGELAALRFANLNENQICELPENFGDLSCLEWLDLGQNSLHDLPESFGKLRMLRFCQLSKNKLELLPSSFGHLSGLEELRLDYNRLAELPESFAQLKQLKTLDLFSNRLTEIPQFLESFTHLTRLDLGENSFGLHHSHVPLLTRPNSYAPRDPKLSDNWRGRMRADHVKLEVTKVVDPDENYDPDNEEPPEVTFNNFALENAVRRNMSLWRSHGMEGERPKHWRGSSEDEDEDEMTNDAKQTTVDPVDDNDDDLDELWCCDDRRDGYTATPEIAEKRHSSASSSHSHLSLSDHVGLLSADQPAKSSPVGGGGRWQQEEEENWDNETLEITTETSQFDLDDAHRFVSTNHIHPSLPDFHLNPFYCLPAVLHAPSFVAQRDQLLASSYINRQMPVDASQFDDAV